MGVWVFNKLVCYEIRFQIIRSRVKRVQSLQNAKVNRGRNKNLLECTVTNPFSCLYGFLSSFQGLSTNQIS